jgi:hypothetical protein
MPKLKKLQTLRFTQQNNTKQLHYKPYQSNIYQKSQKIIKWPLSAGDVTNLRKKEYLFLHAKSLKMKKTKILLAIGLFAVNAFVFSFSSYAKEAAGDAVLKNGLKGSINGVFTCHCPDDAKTCYCNIH